MENQVKTLRQRVFTPRLRFGSLEELNAHLAEAMVREARLLRHPEFSDKSVWEVYTEEKPFLGTQAEAFDAIPATSDGQIQNAWCSMTTICITFPAYTPAVR